MTAPGTDPDAESDTDFGLGTGIGAGLGPRALPRRQGDGWDSVLEPGERLLWQGRPAPGLRLTVRQGALGAVGAVLMGLSGALAGQGWAGYRVGAEAAGGVLALAAAGGALALWCLIWPALSDALRRRGTAYALTDRRALIETDFMGYGLVEWPIGADSPVWRGRGARVASVWFAIYRPPDRALLLRASGRMTGARPVGFEQIEAPDRVLALLEGLRAGG